ncbi:MAG: fibronectin type III domain-containing protein, partial [Bacteroidales bacterium]|nr:fibronectin type III domain-containing protein [Bacteroidales bacterium]
ASITDNGFTLNIDKGDAARYVLAVSNHQMSAYAKTPLTPKAGGGAYHVGDKLRFSYVAAEEDESYELEILAISDAATYQVTDVEPSTEYYYYVWSTDASQSSFAFEPRTCGVATTYKIPVAFGFETASVTPLVNENNLMPAGWDLPGRFTIMKPDLDKYLTVELYAEENSTFNAKAVSPVIEGGRLVTVSVACFFWRPADPVPAEVKLRDGDKISVEWKPVKGGEWTSLYTATNLNTRKGFDTITTPAFYPVEDFQLRFAVQSTGPKKDDDLPTYASISGIRVGTLCKPISSEPVVSQIMNDRATLSWEDEDNSPRAEEYHIRYKQENNTWTGWIAKNRNYTVTRLQDNTYYAMEVAAVCAGDTSDYVNVSFNTLHGLPYEFVADDAAEITFKTGALPVSGTASLT